MSEDLSSTVMVLGNQLMSLFFIALIQIPHLGKVQMICDVYNIMYVVFCYYFLSYINVLINCHLQTFVS